jgi:hypothetical protein
MIRDHALVCGKDFLDFQITRFQISAIRSNVGSYRTPTSCGSSTFASLKNFAASSGGVGLI